MNVGQTTAMDEAHAMLYAQACAAGDMDSDEDDDDEGEGDGGSASGSATGSGTTVKNYQLNFHCRSDATHADFLRRHCDSIVTLTKRHPHYAVRVFTPGETAASSPSSSSPSPSSSSTTDRKNDATTATPPTGPGPGPVFTPPSQPQPPSSTTTHTQPTTHMCMADMLSMLRTKWIGDIVIHSPRIPSTQDVFRRLLADWDGGSSSTKHGWVAIADTQTAARGRRGNAWQSPHGSVSVSINLRVNGNDISGNSNGSMMSGMALVSKIVIFIQYIAAMAVCDAGRTLNSDMRIKWPNDVLDSRGKVAGVLCEASMIGAVNSSNRQQQQQDAMCDIVVGIGVNVFNDTTLTNRVTSKLSSNSNDSSSSSSGGGGWQQIKKEEDLQQQLEAAAAATATAVREKQKFVARLLNSFDRLYTTFAESQYDFEKAGLLAQYVQLWMHDGQTVRLGSENGPKAVIKGLAPNGWVRLLRLDTLELLDLFPDSTSVDLEAGVIRHKT